MAIVWTDSEGNTETTHEGLVMDTFSKECRIMSDVWDTGNFARVWDPEATMSGTTTVLLGYSYSPGSKEGRAVVDFDESRADYQAFCAAQEAARVKAEAARKVQEAEEAEARAERICLHDNIGKGDRVRVVKGRKVPRGTEGTVIWIGSGNYGARCGIKEDGAGKDAEAHWTALSNCVRILPDVPHGTTPDGGWASYLEAQDRAASEARAKLPKKGEWVCLKADNGKTFGKVFWVKEERIGFKLLKKDEPIWSNASDVEILTGDPRKGGVRRDPVGTAEVVEARKSGLEDLPWPYSAIKTLKVEDGAWRAYDAEGNFLVEVPAASAAAIMERLAA